MKKILLMMAVVFLAISANAQTNEQEEASKSEAVKVQIATPSPFLSVRGREI